jgi:Vitamin K epoxide reductase family
MNSNASVDLNISAPPWGYNPSSWKQRIPICLLGGVGFIVAAYLALYQWRFIGNLWDPVFGPQSVYVLDSEISHWMKSWFHVPDFALGAIAYFGAAVFGLAGSTRRWQFRPWLVIIFGIDVIPLGVVSVILVVMQGSVIGYWCFHCLVSAGISLLLVYMAYDEVWSSLAYLSRVWHRSKSVLITWNAFWGRSSIDASTVASVELRRAS